MRKLLILAASTAARLHHRAADQPDRTAAAARRWRRPPPTGRRSAASASTSPAWTAASSPGDNFYRFANGNWDRTTADPRRPHQLRHVHRARRPVADSAPATILEEAARTPGSRIGDFYASFMDEAAVNAAGIAPVAADDRRIKAISNRADWAAEAGRLFRRGVTAPFGGYVNSDDRNPERDDHAPDPGRASACPTATII